MWKKIGVIRIDSGTCVITDASYVWNNCDQLSPRLQDAAMQNALLNGKSVQLKYNAGRDGLAVLLRTGLGDGEYDVMANIEDVDGTGDERVTELRIRFL